MRGCCDRGFSALACDPAWAPGTPKAEMVPLGMLKARRRGEEVIVPGSEAYCTLSLRYLRRLVFAGDGGKARRVSAQVSYDLLFETEQMGRDFEALGFSPGNIACALMDLSRRGYRLSYAEPGRRRQASRA